MAKKNFMQLDCTDEMLEFLDSLDTVNCRAVSIWIHVLVRIRANGGSVEYRGLLQDYTNRHLSRAQVAEILKSSGYFTVNEAKNRIGFSELAKAKFSANDAKGAIGNDRVEASKTTVEMPVDTPEQAAEMPADTPEQGGEMHTDTPEQGAEMHTDTPEQGGEMHIDSPSNAHAYRDRDKEIENKNKDRDSRKKLEKRIDVSILLTRAKTEEEKNFYEQMLRSYPRICAMEKPLTYEDFQKLCKKYPQPKVVTVMQAMENRRTLNRQYLSAYLTALTWLKHE